MLKSYLSNAVIVLIIAMIASCTNLNKGTFQQTVSSWQGSHVSTLLQYWGKPDKKVTTLSGSTMYVYKREQSVPIGYERPPTIGVNFHPNGAPIVTSQANINPALGQNVALFCIVAFEVDKAGTIINTQTQGNHCVADAQFMQNRVNPGARS